MLCLFLNCFLKQQMILQMMYVVLKKISIFENHFLEIGFKETNTA